MREQVATTKPANGRWEAARLEGDCQQHSIAGDEAGSSNSICSDASLPASRDNTEANREIAPDGKDADPQPHVASAPGSSTCRKRGTYERNRWEGSPQCSGRTAAGGNAAICTAQHDTQRESWRHPFHLTHSCWNEDLQTSEPSSLNADLAYTGDGGPGISRGAAALHTSGGGLPPCPCPNVLE